MPIQLTSFIGRREEFAEVCALLRAGHRLVTLTGVGGCGKTRLALAAGEAVAEEYTHGAWLVELPRSPTRNCCRKRSPRPSN